MRARQHSLMMEQAFMKRRKKGVMSRDDMKTMDAKGGWYSDFHQNLLRAAVMPRDRGRIFKRLVWPLRLMSPIQEPVYAEKAFWPGVSPRLRATFSVRLRPVRIKGPYRNRRPAPAVGPDAPFRAFKLKNNRKLS